MNAVAPRPARMRPTAEGPPAAHPAPHTGRDGAGPRPTAPADGGNDRSAEPICERQTNRKMCDKREDD
jgi:hypothetical protein